MSKSIKDLVQDKVRQRSEAIAEHAASQKARQDRLQAAMQPVWEAWDQIKNTMVPVQLNRSGKLPKIKLSEYLDPAKRKPTRLYLCTKPSGFSIEAEFQASDPSGYGIAFRVHRDNHQYELSLEEALNMLVSEIAELICP